MGKDYVYELDEVLNRQNKNAVMEPALAYRYDQGDKTLKDYLALPEGTRVELIDGVFYDMAAPTGLYQRLIIKLAGCLEAGVREYWIVFPEDKKILVYRFERQESRGCPEPEEYTFADKVAVGIWSEACEVDFAQIYESVQFLYLL